MEATATPAGLRPAPVELRMHLRERLAGAGAPGPLGVVAQDVGLRCHDVVRHPAAGDDVALLVHRDGFDRRGADVDPDGDRGRGRGHESDTGVMITSLCLVGLWGRVQQCLCNAVTCEISDR